MPTSTGWPIVLLLLDGFGDGLELVGRILVELVLLVDPPDRFVGRNFDDVELVDFPELGRLGGRGAGHARKLGVHAEIVLEGDRRHRLVFGLDLHPFLGFDRLVQPIRPAPAFHHAPGELVDDDDLAVLDDVIDVALEDDVGLQRLVEMVDDLSVDDVVKVIGGEQPSFGEATLDLLVAFLGQADVSGLLVDLVIIGLERLHDLVELDVEIGLVLGRAGDDQRGARLVDQDRSPPRRRSRS